MYDISIQCGLKKEYLVNSDGALMLEAHLFDKVEIIVATDNRDMSTGAKRNKLIVFAHGKYVSFVDDDDSVNGYYVEEIIEGNTIVQALGAVQYDENELKRQMKGQMDSAIKTDRLKPSEAMRLLDEYERGLKEYTYLTI